MQLVVRLAGKAGIRIDWKRHAVIGLPVTLMSPGVLWGCRVFVRPGG